MSREGSPFEQMAQLVLVRHLQTPLGVTLDGSETESLADDIILNDAGDNSYDPMQRIYLITKGGAPEWWVGFDMLESGKRVGDCAEAIQPSSMLSADTTALEAVGMLDRSRPHFFFVLDHDRITGTLHFSDFFKLPFRLCLFALVLQLEQSALGLIAEHPRESWKSLSDQRRRQAETVYEKRYGSAPSKEPPPFADLLGCTMFCDKGTVLRKRRLLRNVRGNAISEGFGSVEKVRNYCAHTTANEACYRDAPIDRERLGGFISDVQQIIDAIKVAGSGR